MVGFPYPEAAGLLASGLSTGDGGRVLGIGQHTGERGQPSAELSALGRIGQGDRGPRAEKSTGEDRGGQADRRTLRQGREECAELSALGQGTGGRNSFESKTAYPGRCLSHIGVFCVKTISRVTLSVAD